MTQQIILTYRYGMTIRNIIFIKINLITLSSKICVIVHTIDEITIREIRIDYTFSRRKRS